MTPTEVAVPVRGGELAVTRWGSDAEAPLVVGLHGITANGLTFGPLARELGADAHVVAPDLRGRARSASLPGPSSMDQHAEDVASAIEALAPGRRGVVVGHSMGGFVAIALAHARPDLVAHVVLVDGGPALMPPLGPDADVDAVLNAVIGPAMARLSMRWDTLDDYVDHWRPHPALRDCFDAALPYILRDAVQDETGQWRSSVDIEAVRGDATSQLVRALPPLQMPVPASFLRAERGMADDPGGLYPRDVVAPVLAAAGIPLVDVEANHYSITMAAAAAATVAAHIRSVLPPA